MIATEIIISNDKMKNRSSKRVDAQPGKQFCEFQTPVDHRPSDCEHSSKRNVKYKGPFNPYEDRQEMVNSCLVGKSSVQFSKKRRAPESMEGQKKRQKMDRGATQQCCVILKTLMTHAAGWVFNHPVDPVALNIPDYFSIISEPMDLGTIKSRLQENMYLETDRFAADVRLTFSNAARYNPPSNSVHKMASELSEIFEERWKLFEEKWFERSKPGLGKFSFEQVKDFDDARHKKRNNSCLFPEKALPAKSNSNEKKVIRLSLKPKATEQGVLLTTEIPCVNKSSAKNFKKGSDTGGAHVCDSVNGKGPQSLVSNNCGTCDCFPCQCSFSSDLTHVSSDDLCSERSSIRDTLDIVKSCTLTTEANVMSYSDIPKSDSDSQGLGNALGGADMCRTNQLHASYSTSEGWSTPSFEIQLSPKKALRAAMLKSRFADTILKAQEKTLLDHGDKVGAMKIQQEKDKMERRQREERERLEAQIKAAEAASRMRAEAELKQQREQEREAARVAIKMMEKTVELDQNLEFLKELEMLSGKMILIQPHCNARDYPRTPLERLGLYLKEEFFGDADV